MTVQQLLDLVKAADPVLDVTYGSGVFWTGSTRHIYGADRQFIRARSLQADFTTLPFAAQAVPTIVYDPPFHPFVGSAEESRYSGAGTTERELRTIFELGLRECWRVTSRHLLVKCQGFVHNHAPQWMPLWAVGVLGEPFEWAISAREGKRSSGRWQTTWSLRRNHADYLIFDKQGNRR